MWPFALADIQFHGFQVGYGPTTSASEGGIGKVVEKSRAKYAVKVMDFAFSLAHDDMGAFRTWVLANENSEFEFHDPSTKEDDIKVRLRGGRTAIRLSGTDVRAGSDPDERIIAGTASVERRIYLYPRTGTVDFPYNLAEPMLRGFSLSEAGDFKRTQFADGAVQQTKLTSGADRRTIEMECDVLDTDVAALVAWMEATDDGEFRLALPDDVVDDEGMGAPSLVDAQLVGGMGGFGLEGVGGRRHDGLHWQAAITARVAP